MSGDDIEKSHPINIIEEKSHTVKFTKTFNSRDHLQSTEEINKKERRRN